MELVIYAPTEEQFIQNIEFNHEEIKQELAVRLEKYNGLVYSDNNVKDAKADRANLNKFKEAIENKRKEIKRQCMAPYEAFEAKIKEITVMIDKPILAIDSQVKAFEQMKKDVKLEEIKTVYTDRVGDLAKLIPFDKIFNQKWLNATYKGSEIEKEIRDLFARVENDLQVITELQSEYELQIKDAYLKNLDLTIALQEKKRLEEQAAKLAEHKRIQQEREQQTKLDAEAAAEVNPQHSEIPKAVQDQQLYKLDFRVWGTKGQLAELKQFLVDNNIKFGKVD